MKRYIYLFIMTALLGTSCSDEFLNNPVENADTESNFFQTDDDAKKAIDGLYTDFYATNDVGYAFAFFAEIAGGGDDMIMARNSFGEGSGERWSILASYEYPVSGGRDRNSNGIVFNNDEIWTRNINGANWVISSLLQKSSLTDIEKRSLGEAYFIRANAHLLYAYRHGRPDLGVPFYRWEDSNPVDRTKIPDQRATVMENYDLIVQDLDKAYDLLPWFESYGQADYGRVHKAACLAYKIKTLAYWAQHDASKWAEIPAIADKIETEGHRGLLSNYYDVFTIEHQWEQEYIWSLNMSSTTEMDNNFVGSVTFTNAGLDGDKNPMNTWGRIKPTADLYQEYLKYTNPDGTEKDKRRYVTMLQAGEPFTYFELGDGSVKSSETSPRSYCFYDKKNHVTGFAIHKYFDAFRYGDVKANKKDAGPYVKNGGDGTPKTDLNIPLMRFAEVLLYKAEALLRTGKDATAVLNRIAERAGMGSNFYTNATFDDLMHERRCELALEYSDRFQDLKRWAGDAACPGQADALAKLRAPKLVRVYPCGVDMSVAYVGDDPDTTTPGIEGSVPEDPDLSTLKNEKLLDPTYYTVEPLPAAVNYGTYAKRANYDPDIHCVYPYHIDDIMNAGGKLKQNKGYSSGQ